MQSAQFAMIAQQPQRTSQQAGQQPHRKGSQNHQRQRRLPFHAKKITQSHAIAVQGGKPEQQQKQDDLDEQRE